MKAPAIYIVSNKFHGTLYTGVTSNLIQRIYQHKDKSIKGFTQKHGCDKLVYFEQFERMEEAITREKQIKAGSRADKIKLIETNNSKWDDLFEQIV